MTIKKIFGSGLFVALILTLAMAVRNATAAGVPGGERYEATVTSMTFSNVPVNTTNDTQVYYVDVTQDSEVLFTFQGQVSQLGVSNVVFKLARCGETNVCETTPSQTLTFSMSGVASNTLTTFATNLTVHSAFRETSPGNATGWLKVTGPGNANGGTLSSAILRATTLPRLRPR